MVSLKRVAVNGLMSRWRSIRSGVPQGLVLGWALFNVFVGGIDSGMKCILSQFAVHTKLCGPVNMPERKDAIQRDLDSLERDAYANLMKVQGAALGSRHSQIMNAGWAISTLAEYYFGVLVDEKLNMSHVCLQPRKMSIS